MLKLQLKHFFSVLILGFILPRSSFAFVYFTDFSVYHLFYCKPTSVGIIKHLSSLIHLSIHASFTVSPLLFFSIFLVLFCHKSILCAPPPHYPDLHSPNFNAPSLLVVLCIYLILLSKPLSYTSPVLLGHALKGITFSPPSPTSPPPIPTEQKCCTPISRTHGLSRKCPSKTVLRCIKSCIWMTWFLLKGDSVVGWFKL